MEALFTSLVGGDALRARLLATIAEAAVLANSNKIDIHVMAFAFTDEQVATALAEAAARHPSMNIRILADWCQRGHTRGQQVGRLASMELPNLRVRYKNDQPYLWDATAGHVRWSYRVSRGLLHHKTLTLLVDGRPWRLICGSFNWTATAGRSYENLLVITADAEECRQLIARVELEFEALWCDSRATLSPREARRHYLAIVEEYRRNPALPPAEVASFAYGEGGRLHLLDSDSCARQQIREDGEGAEYPVADDSRIAIAFNSRNPEDARSQCGQAMTNRTQRFFLRTPSARVKFVPLTMTNLALDTIFRAGSGDALKIAMYGLSTRVPEYGALLDAARRGVRVLILLDGIAGHDVSKRLVNVRGLEELPLEVRTCRRMMHQKYIVNPQSGTVLTGTANMSTDASARHLEHRIRISGYAGLAEQFNKDFDTIWARVRSDA